jgi:hypothetical protein
MCNTLHEELKFMMKLINIGCHLVGAYMNRMVMLVEFWVKHVKMSTCNSNYFISELAFEYVCFPTLSLTSFPLISLGT